MMEMDVVKISLESLLQRATNPQNENIDTAAVNAFCALINKEKDGPLMGVKLLATRMHSKRELEALQTLHILDYAMQKCGVVFQDEIGKFRFLNEMIKLVSPKYLGAHTPLAVKQKVLQLMYLWMLDYPKQSKIKDAYDMLKKQGVIKDVPLSVSADYQLERQQHNTIFQDEEKGKLLKKLLQSKNPEDLQAANRLIKTMVKEDEKKAELKSRRISELESVQNNIRLLNEMLDSYKTGVSSMDETELIKELHESCVRMRPNISKLASETQHNDEILSEVLRVNDELGQVFDKYHIIMILGQSKPEQTEKQQKPETSLLDDLSLLNKDLNFKADKVSNVDVLCDMLSCVSDSSDLKNDILQPINVDLTQNDKKGGFESLDALSETLLLENLQSTTRLGTQFNKSPTKIPMNMLQLQKSTTPMQSNVLNNIDSHSNHLKTLDLDAELSLLLNTHENIVSDVSHLNDAAALDDLLVDITTTPTPTPTMTPTLSRTLSSSSNASSGLNEATSSKKEKPQDINDDTDSSKNTVKLKLSDLFVDLKSIKPSGVEPIVALNEQNGVSLTLHFAKDKPHEDVSVIVVSIANKNELPMKNVLFRAIVPKTCKVKLQPPSASDLPACNPFLPLSAITQVMLIANPEKVHVSLKFIVSYNLDDETMTEMGELDALPT